MEFVEYYKGDNGGIDALFCSQNPSFEDKSKHKTDNITWDSKSHAEKRTILGKGNHHGLSMVAVTISSSHHGLAVVVAGGLRSHCSSIACCCFVLNDGICHNMPVLGYFEPP